MSLGRYYVSKVNKLSRSYRDAQEAEEAARYLKESQEYDASLPGFLNQTQEWFDALNLWNSGASVAGNKFEILLKRLNSYFKQGQATPGRLSNQLAIDAYNQWQRDNAKDAHEFGILRAITVGAIALATGGAIMAAVSPTVGAAGAAAAGAEAAAGAAAGTAAAGTAAAGTAAAGTAAAGTAAAGTAAATGAVSAGVTVAGVSTGLSTSVGMVDAIVSTALTGAATGAVTAAATGQDISAGAEQGATVGAVQGVVGAVTPVINQAGADILASVPVGSSSGVNVKVPSIVKEIVAAQIEKSIAEKPSVSPSIAVVSPLVAASKTTPSDNWGVAKFAIPVLSLLAIAALTR